MEITALDRYEARRVRESLKTLIRDWASNVDHLVSQGVAREEAERRVSESLTQLIATGNKEEK